MISDNVIRLAHGPVVVHAGTRDGQLVPAHHMVVSLRVEPDRRTVKIVVPERTALHLRENLADNGRLAVTFGHSPSHESYQLKGTALEVRAASDDELALGDAWLQTMKHHDLELGAPPEAVEAYDRIQIRPAITVRFRVDAVFDQTPGPRAGQPVPAA